jgi:hypothetical protein
VLEGLGRCGETARRSLTRLAVSRRPPISLYKIVARTHMYTYAAQVWDSSLVQGPFSVAPSRAKPERYDSQLIPVADDDGTSRGQRHTCALRQKRSGTTMGSAASRNAGAPSAASRANVCPAW